MVGDTIPKNSFLSAQNLRRCPKCSTRKGVDVCSRSAQRAKKVAKSAFYSNPHGYWLCALQRRKSTLIPSERNLRRSLFWFRQLAIEAKNMCAMRRMIHRMITY